MVYNPAEASSATPRPSSWAGTRTEIPMTTPFVPGVCPCGRPGDGDEGFCDEHAGAVAFKVPVGRSGEVLPAVWWHWPHPQPCPEGEAWRIACPSGGHDEAAWACTHRTHDDERSEEATG